MEKVLQQNYGGGGCRCIVKANGSWKITKGPSPEWLILLKIKYSTFWPSEVQFERLYFKFKYFYVVFVTPEVNIMGNKQDGTFFGMSIIIMLLKHRVWLKTGIINSDGMLA